MWIFIAVVSYALLALASLIDKFLLTGPLQNPKTYVFYIGMLGGIIFLLIPFGFLEFPALPLIALGLSTGILRTFALLALFSGLRHFEASRIVPAIGGAVPVIMAILTILLFKENDILSPENLIAFMLLVGGTVLISIERHAAVTLQSLKYSMIAAFFFSSFLVLSKVVYEAQTFFSGFIWILMGVFLSSLAFLAFKDVRSEVFGRKKAVPRKMSMLFIGNQAMAGGAVLLQNLAVALVPLGLLAFVGALAGFQYAFLFFLALFLSTTFPRFLKEEISRKVLAQKVVSIVLVGTGLVLLII
jgi:hypothetical protein